MNSVIDSMLCKGYLDGDFLVDGYKIQQYLKEYSVVTGTGGRNNKRSNQYYAIRLAALNLLDFKRHTGRDITEGFVYVITNPAWPNMAKIGMTDNPHRRLSQFLTYSPNRDYSLDHWSFFTDKRLGEKLIHSKFEDCKDHEWFNLSGINIQTVFKQIKDESLDILKIQA